MRLLEHPYRSFDHVRCVCDQTAPLNDPLWSRIKLESPTHLLRSYIDSHGELPRFVPWLVRYTKVMCTRCDLTLKGYGERLLCLEIDEAVGPGLRAGHHSMKERHVGAFRGTAFVTIINTNFVHRAPHLCSVLSFDNSRLQLWTPISDA